MGRQAEFEKAKRGRPPGTRIKGEPGYAPKIVTVAPRGKTPHQRTVWERVVPKHAEHGVGRTGVGATAPRATTLPYLKFDSKSGDWKLTDDAIRMLAKYEAAGGDSLTILRGLARYAVFTEGTRKTELPAASLKELEELGKGVICVVPKEYYPPSVELEQKWVEGLERLLGDRQEILRRAFTEPIGVDWTGRLQPLERAERRIYAVTEKRYKRVLIQAEKERFEEALRQTEPFKRVKPYVKLYRVERVQTPSAPKRGVDLIVPTEAGLELLAEKFPSRVEEVRKPFEERLEAYKAGRLIYMTQRMHARAKLLLAKLRRQLEQARGV
jgi:hypothetical protein